MLLQTLPIHAGRSHSHPVGRTAVASPPQRDEGSTGKDNADWGRPHSLLFFPVHE